MRPVASNDNLQEPSRPSHSYCVSQTLRGSTDPSLRVIMCAGHRKPFEDLPTRRFDPYGGSVLCVANPSRIYRPDASSYNVRRPSRTGCICCHPLCVHIPRAGCRRDLRGIRLRLDRRNPAEIAGRSYLAEYLLIRPGSRACEFACFCKLSCSVLCVASYRAVARVSVCGFARMCAIAVSAFCAARICRPATFIRSPTQPYEMVAQTHPLSLSANLETGAPTLAICTGTFSG